MALLEEVQRKSQKMTKNISHPLKYQPIGKKYDDQTAQQVSPNLKQDKQPKTHTDNRQQLAIAGDQDLVDDPLQVEWPQHREDLQRNRHKKNQGQCPPQTSYRSNQLTYCDGWPGFDTLEIIARLYLERYPGKVLRGLGIAHPSLANSRIQNRYATRASLSQYNEMIQIPVEYERSPELGKVS
jgi:hypothetical protein